MGSVDFFRTPPLFLTHRISGGTLGYPQLLRRLRPWLKDELVNARYNQHDLTEWGVNRTWHSSQEEEEEEMSHVTLCFPVCRVCVRVCVCDSIRCLAVSNYCTPYYVSLYIGPIPPDPTSTRTRPCQKYGSFQHNFHVLVPVTVMLTWP